MQLSFYKYQGAGNDFIMFDDRERKFPAKDHQLIEKLCDRRFGIGADGLILLQSHPDFDFEMVYFNSDGHTSSMCGNGGRCIAAFAKIIGIIKPVLHFIAIDGAHEAKFEGSNVALKMNDVNEIDIRDHVFVLNTGSPHYVKLVPELEKLNIVTDARAIRYNDEFKGDGINVNFIQPLNTNHIQVRTYERGVEDETYSCGTGVVASAISYFESNKSAETAAEIHISTKGGELQVRFMHLDSGAYTDVWLIGPAEFVFSGEIQL